MAAPRPVGLSLPRVVRSERETRQVGICAPASLLSEMGFTRRCFVRPDSGSLGPGSCSDGVSAGTRTIGTARGHACAGRVAASNSPRPPQGPQRRRARQHPQPPWCGRDARQDARQRCSALDPGESVTSRDEVHVQSLASRLGFWQASGTLRYAVSYCYGGAWRLGVLCGTVSDGLGRDVTSRARVQAITAKKRQRCHLEVWS